MGDYIGTPTWATPLDERVHDANTTTMLAAVITDHFTLDAACRIAAIVEREINERCM